LLKKKKGRYWGGNWMWTNKLSSKKILPSHKLTLWWQFISQRKSQKQELIQFLS
jgi:hypothetical protein